MKISFGTDKHCCCYKNYVCNPENRDYIKGFKKHFPKEIMEAAIRLHQRLINQPNVSAFNNTYGNTRNGIEFVSGIGDNEPLLLKVRVNVAYRKFFNAYSIEDEKQLILKKDWSDNFDQIKDIYIKDINKHNY